MKKDPESDVMAGEQDSYIRFRVPDKLKARFQTACDARGADMSKTNRHLIEAFCDAAEDGAALIAPYDIASKKKKK